MDLFEALEMDEPQAQPTKKVTKKVTKKKVTVDESISEEKKEETLKEITTDDLASFDNWMKYPEENAPHFFYQWIEDFKNGETYHARQCVMGWSASEQYRQGGNDAHYERFFQMWLDYSGR